MTHKPPRRVTRQTIMEMTIPLASASDELLAVMGVCCVPVLIGTFRRESLVALDNRHVGRRCAGKLDSVDIKEWRRAKGLVK